MRTEPGEGPPLGRGGGSLLPHPRPPGPLDTPTQTLLFLEAGRPTEPAVRVNRSGWARKEASVCPGGLPASHGASH